MKRTKFHEHKSIQIIRNKTTTLDVASFIEKIVQSFKVRILRKDMYLYNWLIKINDTDLLINFKNIILITPIAT